MLNSLGDNSSSIHDFGNFVQAEQLVLLENTIKECAERVFNKKLHRHQIMSILHLLIHRRLFLALTTGSGKSTVVHVTGMVLGCVSLTIVPLLSLGADQVAYMNAHRDSHGLKRFFAVNLDEIKNPNAISSLSKLFLSLRHNSLTVYLYASPQTLDR